MKHVLYIVFLFAGFVCWGQSNKESLSFEEVYNDLFDSTMTETDFSGRLVTFYDELDSKKVLTTSENIGDTYEYFNSHFEDSLELSVGSHYVYEWQPNAVLLYRNKLIISHQPPEQRLEAVSFKVMNPEDDKKEQIAIPVVSDSVFTMKETIFNLSEGIQVTFQIQYKWKEPRFFFRHTSMKEMSHGNKEILEISNVRWTRIMEE